MVKIPRDEVIPEAPYRRRDRGDFGFEAIDLARLFKRQGGIGHRLDRLHRIGFHSFIYVESGKGRHAIDFREYEFGPGSAILTAQGQTHAFDENAGMGGVQLAFTREFLLRNGIDRVAFATYGLLECGILQPVASAEETEREGIGVIVGELVLEYARPDRVSREDIVASLLRLLIVKTARVLSPVRIPAQAEHDDASDSADSTKARGLPIFLAFREALSDEFGCLADDRARAKSRDAARYAETIGVSYRGLNEACKAVAQKTAKRFLDDWIVLEAKRRLADRELSVKEISAGLGFDEPTNLVKFFRERTGMTPTAFRDSLG